MIEPDRGKVDLDLADGKTPLKLWYTPGAIRLLCKALGIDLPLGRVLELLTKHLTPASLATFIWAGRLWEDRKLSVEPIVERLDWCALPLEQLTAEVQTIVYLGLTGRAISVGGADERTDPKAPTAEPGAGTMPSDSPSAKPVIQ